MKSDPDLIKACMLWDKITTKMHNGGYEMPEELEHAGTNQPYSSGDYNPLQCRITGKQAELTVGSSTGHKAKVDLEKETLEYFDNDEDPNEAMKQLLEGAGLECETSDDGVKCEGVKKENVQEVFKVLAMPTSMDFRIQHCKEERREDPTDICADNCADELSSNYSLPNYGCDCSEWENECIEECVSNWEYDDEPEDCIEAEVRFFNEGPKKEKLTKAEAIIPSKKQKKLEEW